MNQLSQYLVDGILNEGEDSLGGVALFGGGFKPPTRGHLEVVLQGLKENPEVKQVQILVGSGERNGVTQEESIKIWEIYKRFIPVSTQIIKVQSPFSYIKTYLQDHQDENVYIFIGARLGNEADDKDVAERSAYAKKYSDKAIPVKITTIGGVSGTKARQSALSGNNEEFITFFPEQLTDSEREEIIQMVSSVIKEVKLPINENATYSKDIDIIEKCAALTNHMREKGYNIDPVPAVEFVNGDSENARDFFGKTAYYNPESQTIVLYTEGRHPKDIVRSFAHEMIHHIQNLENRLGDVSTTNTMEDDNIDKLEQEANLKGTMTFRNWTDSLNEGKQVGILYHSTSESQYDNIIKQNIMKGGFININGNETVGISTTRNKNFWYDNNPIQIVLDGDKISNNYKIQPYDYWGREYDIPGNPQVRDEDEEIILTPEIKNIKDYIISVNYKNKPKTPTNTPIFDDTLNEGLGDVSLDYIKTKLPKLNSYPKSDIILSKGDFVYLKIPQDKDFGMAAEIKAFYKKDGTLVAQSSFDYDKNGKLKGTLDVRPDKRRLGIATEIYKLSEKIIGDTIFPEEKNTEDAKKFWQQKNRSFGPKTDDNLNEANKPYKHKHGFDDKLGKDPFGLNQFAREIAEEVISEGRYDTLANKLSSIVFEAFKDIHDRGDKEGEFEFRVDHPDDEHDIPSKDFFFDFVGKVEITDDEYGVDGGANAGFDSEGEEITPMLSVNFKIPKNPDWQQISFDIKDVIRHELEHLTQEGDNVKTGKHMEDDQLIRDLIDADMLSKSQYFKLEKEVDAMLQGLYFKAKKSKRPFGDVIDDYLNIFLDQETISPQEKEDILNTWRSRRKALSLPIFEQENMEDKYKIYLDMDGVIVDFDKRFTDLAGMGPREYESSFGKEKFWDFIDSKEKGGGVGFWVGMPWMPGGPELYNRVAQHNHALLSSPSRSESSKLGKRLWKKKYTPNTDLILSLAANKKNYADGNSILIDDRESNIQQWREAGGIGILYKSADQVNKELDKLGL